MNTVNGMQNLSFLLCRLASASNVVNGELRQLVQEQFSGGGSCHFQCDWRCVLFSLCLFVFLLVFCFENHCVAHSILQDGIALEGWLWV